MAKAVARHWREGKPRGVGVGRGRGAMPFWLLGVTLMLLMMGTNVPSPLYGVYRGEWGFSVGVLTLIFASYVATLIPSLLLFGGLSDALGRRRVTLVGLSVAVAGSLVFSAAQGLGWLFAARAVQGVAVGIASGAITAALAELQPREDRGAAALVATVALAGGGAVGPLFGGVLAQYAPFPLTLPYLTYLVLLVPAVLGLLAVMPETVGQRETGYSAWRPRVPRIPAGIRRPFALGSGACFCGWAVTGLFISLVPSYASRLLEVGNLALAGGVTFTMLGCASAVQVLARKVSYRQAMFWGSAALVAGLAALVVAVPAQSVWLLLAGALFDGAGLGLTFMGGFGLVGQIAPSESRAETLSACYVVIYLGVGLPVVGVGFLSGAVGLFVAVVSFAGVIGGFAVLIAMLVAGSALASGKAN